MHDQVNDLTERGIDAMIACQTTTAEDKIRILRELKLGHPKLRLLYITPESLFTSTYLDALKICHQRRQLRRLVIDEAHCIDVSFAQTSFTLADAQEWGFTFRSAYRNLSDFRPMFRDVPITVRQTFPFSSRRY